MSKENKYYLPLFAIVFASVLFCACNNGNANIKKYDHDAIANDSANYTSIQWIDSAKNFGTTKYGDKVNIEYTFKNIGNKPLYLLNVQPTCGCTIADYTRSAVMPDKEGYVKAVYDSHHGEPGRIQKSIIVTSNTTNDTHFVLTFNGEVVK